MGNLKLLQVFLVSLMAMNFLNEVYSDQTTGDNNPDNNTNNNTDTDKDAKTETDPLTNSDYAKDKSGQLLAKDLTGTMFDDVVEREVERCCKVKFDPENDAESLSTCKTILKHFLEKNPKTSLYFTAKVSSTRKLIQRGGFDNAASRSFIIPMTNTNRQKSIHYKSKFIDTLGAECENNSAVLTRDIYKTDIEMFANVLTTIIFPIYSDPSNAMGNFFEVETDDEKIRAALQFQPFYIQTSVFGETPKVDEFKELLQDNETVKLINSKPFIFFANILSVSLSGVKRVCDPSVVMDMFNNARLQVRLKAAMEIKNPFNQEGDLDHQMKLLSSIEFPEDEMQKGLIHPHDSDGNHASEGNVSEEGSEKSAEIHRTENDPNNGHARDITVHRHQEEEKHEEEHHEEEQHHEEEEQHEDSHDGAQQGDSNDGHVHVTKVDDVKKDNPIPQKQEDPNIAAVRNFYVEVNALIGEKCRPNDELVSTMMAL